MQFSGPTKYALTYVDWIKDDDRFSDILVQISPTTTGHAFPRLRVRYKSSLVQARSPLHHPKIILFFISCVACIRICFSCLPNFFSEWPLLFSNVQLSVLVYFMFYAFCKPVFPIVDILLWSISINYCNLFFRLKAAHLISLC